MCTSDTPDEETTLFVYGSLVDPVCREEVICRPVGSRPATIRDYELGRARYFHIRRRLGASTPGLLLLNLTPHEFHALDRYEEIPRLYIREKVEVQDLSGNALQCWVYLPTALTLSGSD